MDHLGSRQLRLLLRAEILTGVKEFRGRADSVLGMLISEPNILHLDLQNNYEQRRSLR